MKSLTDISPEELQHCCSMVDEIYHSHKISASGNDKNPAIIIQLDKKNKNTQRMLSINTAGFVLLYSFQTNMFNPVKYFPVHTMLIIDYLRSAGYTFKP
jgi:DNA polymerase IIIc chi subunit